MLWCTNWSVVRSVTRGNIGPSTPANFRRDLASRPVTVQHFRPGPVGTTNPQEDHFPLSRNMTPDEQIRRDSTGNRQVQRDSREFHAYEQIQSYEGDSRGGLFTSPQQGTTNMVNGGLSQPHFVERYSSPSTPQKQVLSYDVQQQQYPPRTPFPQQHQAQRTPFHTRRVIPGSSSEYFRGKGNGNDTTNTLHSPRQITNGIMTDPVRPRQITTNRITTNGNMSDHIRPRQISTSAVVTATRSSPLSMGPPLTGKRPYQTRAISSRAGLRQEISPMGTNGGGDFVGGLNAHGGRH